MEVDWLNRIGLTLQFIALFLVTPEILGKDKVRVLTNTYWTKPQGAVTEFIKKSPLAKAIIFCAFIIFGFVLCIVYGLAYVPPYGTHHSPAVNIIATFEAFLIFATVPRALGYLALNLGALVANVAENAVKSERSFLSIGALLFTLGFICLMWATFVAPE